MVTTRRPTATFNTQHSECCPDNHTTCTGRFIMYSGITKIYYKKTARQVFTEKYRQREKLNPPPLPSKLFFIAVHISGAWRCECYVVRKWPLRGRNRFVCWNNTRVSLWLPCNVNFVQSKRRNHLQDLADLKSRIIAIVKNIDAPMLTRVCGKN